MTIIDCAEDYSSKVAKLKALNVEAVIRYYNPLTHGRDSGKSLRPAEAKIFAQNGIKVGIVVEGEGLADGYTGVDFASGTRDASGVLAWLPSVGITPSPAVCVYFAVDTDATASQINTHVAPYFDAINQVFNKLPDSQKPRVGVYGSGWTGRVMKLTNRASEIWIAGSTGWAEYHDALASGNWTILQKIYPGEMWNGFNADTDTVNAGKDAGFVLASFPPPSVGSVEWAQRLLNQVDNADLDEDGIIGPETKNALIIYQQRHGIPQTGELDQSTVATMQEMA